MYLITLHYQYFIPLFPEMQKLHSWKGIFKAISSHLSRWSKPEDVFHEICDSVVWASASFCLTFDSCVGFFCVSDGTEDCSSLKGKFDILENVLIHFRI